MKYSKYLIITIFILACTRNENILLLEKLPLIDDLNNHTYFSGKDGLILDEYQRLVKNNQSPYYYYYFYNKIEMETNILFFNENKVLIENIIISDRDIPGIKPPEYINAAEGSPNY